jgi:predicted NBD/HSP70 family sugar kinase
MADISTFEEGVIAAHLGVDIVATTLSGYSQYSSKQTGPDIQLVRELAQALDVPVIAEGRIGTPDEARLAQEAGAYAVVVGSMITRPHLITERFIAQITPRKSREIVLAMDIGGTKIATGVVDSDGTILEKEQIATERQEGGTAILHQAISQIDRMLKKNVHLAPQAIGVATGGQVDRSSHIIGGTEMISGWIGVPLKDTITKSFELPTVILNDGHAAALAEAHFGAGKGQPSMLCVVIGTGMGGGLVINGEIQHGAHGLAGSVGQLKVSPEGIGYIPLEAIVSGPGLMETYNQRVAQETQVVSGEQVARRAHHSDPVAIEAIREMGAWLGLGLSHALHTYDASCVVLGGSVAQIGDLLLESAKESLRQHGHETVANTPIFAAKLGPDAGLVGAAIYAQKVLVS